MGEIMKDNYNEIVMRYTPKENVIKNAFMTFIFGGLFGVLSELLLRLYIYLFTISRQEAGILVIITLIIVASLLTAFGVFDVCVSKLRSALIIPITGFAHSMTSAALEYRKEGLVLGLGPNIFKLAGTVLLYGTVSAYFFGILRLLIMGG
jgi:stage V sporulation protein AC